MAERGLAALIVADPSNMAWLTGYDGWSFYVHQAVILTHDAPPRWWGRPMDAVGAQFTVWMGDDALFSYPDAYVQNSERHPYAHLAGLLSEWGLEAARIGVEMENYYYSAAAHSALGAALPAATLLDATGLVNWRRLIKSPAEIALIRRAAKIVEAAHARIAEVVEPGVRKCDVIAEILATQVRGSDDEEGAFGGDYTAIAPMAPSGAEASAAHLTWDDRPMRRGEATFFEIAGCYRRYHCPQSRTVFLGDPPDAVRRAEAVALEGLEAALTAAAPGETAETVEAAWRRVLSAHGLEKESRIGYSIGLSYPPDWGERTLSLRPGDQTVLQPGMTLHLIPALWLDDFGIEITETFLVTETGAEPFCQTPRPIVVKG